MPISHLDCLRIDFFVREMAIEWKVRCNKHSRWVRQLLTSSELHWFSLAVPSRDGTYARSKIGFCSANWWASPCDPDFKRKQTQTMPKKCLRHCNDQSHLYALHTEQIARGSMSGCCSRYNKAQFRKWCCGYRSFPTGTAEAPLPSRSGLWLLIMSQG